MQWFIVGLFLPLLALNGWILLLILQYFQSLINVVVAATLLSFILDYPVKLLERYRLKRPIAILLVLLGLIIVLAILGVTLVPIAIDQGNTFLERLPSWLESARLQLQGFEKWAAQYRLISNVGSLTAQSLERLSSQLQDVSGHLLGGLVSAIGRVLDLVLTLVLTFYMLLHGAELWDGLFSIFPAKFRDRVRESLGQNFHNYYVGQATLAAIIGVSITLTLLLLQVPFGLLFGIIEGIFALIPFGGVSGILLISILVGLNSIWLGGKVFIIALAVEQAIENAIAPRLLGGFIGLNPVWILISLLIAAKIAGFLGLVIAVPIAGFIKSMVDLFNPEKIPMPPPEELVELRSRIED
ncbi:AI-2E family transporter [Oscillatoria sp. FACHB-1406]|uniref:AI-2E family transporter n=1 Tax=Oscillatoria sp. FACHB-1406 TaxID=2692846 RepID=UPI003220498F